MTKMRQFGVAATMILGIPALASAASLQADFAGYADHSGGVPGVYSSGETYTAYLILNTNQIDPWYPWSQPALEYTAVVSTTVLAFTDDGTIQTASFADAAVDIYEDAGTVADFGNVATFTDGTKILTGTISGMFALRAVIPNMPYNVSGSLSFTGGAGFGDLAPGCVTGLLLNDFIAFEGPVSPPSGFEEAYDAQWICPGPTGTEEATWGRVKTSYRE